MDDLDFSALTDDQLVALIRAACAEAVRRGAATGAAARDAYLDATEVARVAHAAAEREAERVRREETERAAREAAQRVQFDAAAAREAQRWATRKGAAQAAAHLFGDLGGFDTSKLTIVVWKRPGGTERRVFVQFGFDDKLATYHVTGNTAKNITPGKLELRRDKDLLAHQASIRSFCEALSALYTEIKLDVSAALAWNGEAIPLAGYTPPAAPPVEATP